MPAKLANRSDDHDRDAVITIAYNREARANGFDSSAVATATCYKGKATAALAELPSQRPLEASKQQRQPLPFTLLQQARQQKTAVFALLARITME